MPCDRRPLPTLHPQDVVCPERNILPSTIDVFPQSQEHNHLAIPENVFASLDMTRSLENLIPIQFLSAMFGLYQNTGEGEITTL